MEIGKREFSEEMEIDDAVPAKFVKVLIDTQEENKTLLQKKHACKFCFEFGYYIF